MFRWLIPKPETLDLQYNPPPDGTYPPRLLLLEERRDRAYSISVWMPEGETISLIKDELDVRREGLTCTLIPLNTLMSEVLVNGQPLVVARPLKDGDFILWRKCRYIFQADPVKDRREWMQYSGDIKNVEHLKLSRRLKQYVLINAEGISLSGGKDFTRWEQITQVLFLNEGTSSFKIYVQGREVKNTLKSTSGKETSTLLKWLFITIPFDLPITVALGRFRIHEWMPDAYWAAALTKLYLPAQNNERVLPADEKMFFAIPSRQQKFQRHISTLIWLGFSALLIFLGIMVKMADDPATKDEPLLTQILLLVRDDFPLLLRVYFVIFVVLLVILCGFIFVIRFDEWLREQLSAWKQRRQTAKEAKKKTKEGIQSDTL